MDDSPARTLVWLDPRSIREWYGCRDVWSKLRSMPDRIGLPDQARRGSWDRRTVAFAQHPTYCLMRALEQCEYDVGRLRRLLGDRYPRSRGKPPWHLDTPEFVRYADYYRKIAQSMRRDGYLPAATHAHHLRVAVARDGRPVKISGGNHRLALAQLVNLSAVQAEIRFVHAKWSHVAVSAHPGELAARLEEAGFALCKSHESGFAHRETAVPGP